MIDEETNKEDQTIKPNNPKKFNKKKVIISVGVGVVVIGIIITILIVFLKEKTESDPAHDEDHPEQDQNHLEQDQDHHQEKLNIIINRKLNEVKQYKEIITEITSIEFSSNNPSKRFLDSNNKNIIINYLFNIYDVEYKTEEILYSAYLVISNITERKNNLEEESLGGYDILSNEEIKEDIPIIDLKFNHLGNIIKFSYPEKINSTLFSYLNNFMIKVIPDLSKSEINDKYIKSKKINEFSNGEISFEDGTINEEDNI